MFLGGLIKILTEEDLTAYRDLRLYAFRESSSSFSESYEDEENESCDFFRTNMGIDPEHYTFGYFNSENQLKAVATFKRDKRSKARHKSFIHTMYVDPKYRKTGIGKSLLGEIISQAKKMNGLEQIHLWVLNPETSAARRLYANIGFIGQGTIVRKDLKINGAYVDGEYMTLDLNNL